MHSKKGFLAAGLVTFAAFANHDNTTLNHSKWLSVQTADTDGNGKIDHITIKFDRPVRSDSEPYGLNTLPVNDPGYRVTSTTHPGASGSYNDTITLVVAEGADGDTGAKPEVFYRHDHTHHEYSVYDQSAVQLLEGSGRRADDKAGPVIVKALYHVPEGSSLGMLQLRFSEPLTDPGSFPDPSAVFELAGGGSFGTGATISTGQTANDDTLEIQFGSGAQAPTLGSTTVHIKAGVTAIVDQAATPNAPPANNQTVVLEDIHGAPRVLGATALDRDGNGKIDTYKVVFDRPVDDSTFNPAQYTGSPYRLIGLASVSGDSANDRTLYLGLEEPAKADTGTKGEFTANAGLVQGLEGAPTASIAAGDVTEADDARPIFVSARFTPGSPDITVAFSEPVWTSTLGGNLDVDDFVLDDPDRVLQIASITFISGQSTGTVTLSAPLNESDAGRVHFGIPDKEVFDGAYDTASVPHVAAATMVPLAVATVEADQPAVSAGSDSPPAGHSGGGGQCFVATGGGAEHAPAFAWMLGGGLALLALARRMKRRRS